MDDSLLGKSAFATDGLWVTSSFTLDEETDSLFRPLDLELPPLDVGSKQSPYDGSLELGIPEPEDLDNIDETAAKPPLLPPVELRESPCPSAPFEDASQSSLPDVWTLELGPEKEQAPRLKTWEAFERKHVPSSEKSTYLSEAGTAAFDAAIAQHKPRGNNAGVLPQHAMLRPLCNLAMGRSSVFFQWNVSKNCFVQTLQDVPMSGLSVACSQSYVDHLMGVGTRLRRLRDFSSSFSKQNKTCSALIAFKAALADVLDTVERNVAADFQAIRSLLQLQKSVFRPAQLLSLLEDCVSVTAGITSDEEAIARLSDQVYTHVEADGVFVPVLRALLARVSAPWLDRLKQDIGLDDGHVSVVAPQLDSDRDTVDATALDTSFDERDVAPKPAFVDSEDWSVIVEMKASIKLLRVHAPHLLHRSGEAGSWEAVDGQPHTPPQPLHLALATGDLPQRQDDLEGLAWAQDDKQELYFQALEGKLGLLPEDQPSNADGRLPTTVDIALTDGGQVPVSPQLFLTTSPDYSPLADLRPQLSTQSRDINKHLLRFLFNDCKLEAHLELQHGFQLLGNGDFVARLSAALFGSNMQSAQRKRGNIPTSETMGLRLNTRNSQQWPPASSELQLTLMGILTDAYQPGNTTSPTRRADETSLPGGLSFSIRELSDKEIDQVMDVQSTYALDFLRLQYTPPAPLDAILTPSAMQKYDEVFRFLLKLLRVVYLTVQLKAVSFRRPGSKVQHHVRNTTQQLRFAHRAHHVASHLMSFFMNEGISIPWKDFSSSLTAISKPTTTETPYNSSKSTSFPAKNHSSTTSTTTGISTLRSLHETYLDRIRTRLFLKRKQERLREAVENVLATILRVATTLAPSETSVSSSQRDKGDGSLEDFDTAMARLIQALLDQSQKFSKPQSALGGHGGGGGVGEDEATEAAAELATRLDWNAWFAGSSQ
ncbi:hypothetical protein MBLNU230_g5223t1 [Neophaeotheca triangularis]